MIKKKQSRMSYDQQFFEELIKCLDEEKKICVKLTKLRKEQKVCVKKGIEICANVMNEAYIVKSPGTKKGKRIYFQYHKQTVKAAEAFLKKFAVRVKTKKK